MQRSIWVRQLFALVGKEFQQIVRDPSSYLVAGVLPFIFLLLFGYGITLDAGVLRLAVLDQSGGRNALSLAADFAHSPWFATRPVGTMAEAGRAADAGADAPADAPLAGVARLEAGTKGVSTITWFTARRLASGWHTMRAKLVSLRRSTRSTLATGRPGAYTPSTPLVVSKSPSLTSSVTDM